MPEMPIVNFSEKKKKSKLQQGGQREEQIQERVMN